MGHPILLKTKITMPVYRSNYVSRNALMEKLDNGLRCRLTSLSAPAGCGKTTLLAQWAHRCQLNAAWLSLDEMDNDLIRFWRYMVQTLDDTCLPHLSERLKPVIAAVTPTSFHVCIDALLNELASESHSLVLIVDDYHMIGDEHIHLSLSYFIEYLPAHVHLYVASRQPLPFSTAKWSARGQACLINAQQLLFSEAETNSFYQDVVGIPLSAEQIAKLTACTEGWVAGLQLAAVSLTHHLDREQFFTDFNGTHRTVSEFLLHEVWLGLPQDIQHFLTSTSVLRRMDAQICQALTGVANSQQMLMEIEKLGLLLVPLDEHRLWFRYHHLFSDFLQEQLKREDSQRWHQLHRNASEGFAARDMFEEAIDHAILAKDFDLVITLLETHIHAVIQRGEFATLLRWMDSLPQPLEMLTPHLSLLYVFILIACGQFSRVEVAFAHLEAKASDMNDPKVQQPFLSGLFFIKANYAFSTGNFQSWFELAAQLPDALPKSPEFYYFNYNTTEPFVRRTAFGLKGVMSADTEIIGKKFMEILNAHGWGHSLIHMYVMQALAEGYYEQNRQAESAALLSKVEKVARQQRVPGLFVPWALTAAKWEVAYGQVHVARQIVMEAILTIKQWAEFTWLSSLNAFLAQLDLQQGHITQADMQIANAPSSFAANPTLHKELEAVTLARLLLAKRQEEEALHILAALKVLVKREELLTSHVEIANLQALAEMQRGNESEALLFVKEALIIGEANCYVRSFLDEGEAMAHLLELYLRSDWDIGSPSVSRLYVQSLLSLFPSTARKQSEDHFSLLEPLTDKEVVILSMLGQGFTNKQISEELGNTLGTVKVYLHRIYGKLGVANRTQALLKAQELSLLYANLKSSS